MGTGRSVRPDTVSNARVKPDEVNKWFECATKRPPLPDAGACSRLAAIIERQRRATGKDTPRKLDTRPVAAAIKVVSDHLAHARKKWMQGKELLPARDVICAANAAVECIGRAETALSAAIPYLELEDTMARAEKSWHAAARRLFPHVLREWLAVGRKWNSPHPTDPICRFIHFALGRIEPPAPSINAIAMELRRSLKNGGIPALFLPQQANIQQQPDC
jgi:hypothetical protein